MEHITHTPIKFDGHWRCRSGDPIFFQISRDLIIYESHYSWLLAIVLVEEEIQLLQISRDHMTHESHDSVGGIPP